MLHITVRGFSRGSSPIRLAYGKLDEHGEFIVGNDLRKAANFDEIATRKVSGKFGTPSYTEEYHIDESKITAVLAVQKWEGIGTTSPRKVWEVIHAGIL